MPGRLKSLELHGYKTFANRILFDFSESITAIVGPNGSGKSNVADSLRWVLGEQSYSLLRGKKTEDMIFSGSELRPRAGMAQATVTFDNSDGWLPIDFSEVAITRRAYRDGENEYLINGQRMRLRDVSELLSSSGLAERTYTIIGQGLVDAALSLKAEERRRLFEEAAGVGLHRGRREEALRRLEATRRNLERVQDILAELEPRLQSLERQARRQQEYNQVKSDLRLVLHDWYGYHWHHAQKELAEARRVARIQDRTLQTARQEQAILDEKLKGLRERILALRGDLNGWHHQLSALHAQREQSNLDLALTEERIRSLEAQEQQLHAESLRLREESALNAERVAVQAGEAARLEEELHDANRQLADSRKALAERQAARAAVDQEIHQADQRLAEIANRIGKLNAGLTGQRLQIERDTQAEGEITVEVERLRQEAQMLAWRYDSTLKAQEKSKAALDQGETDYQHHSRALSETEARQEEVARQRLEALNALAASKAQYSLLAQAEASLTGYAEGTRLLLQAGREGGLAGVGGTLIGEIVVPSEYEAAIAVALGEYLQAVVIQAEVEPALAVLVEGAARGTILPLHKLVPESDHPVVLETGDGIIGWADELIQAPEVVRPAVGLLLGSTLIVEDQSAARRVLAAIAHLSDQAALRLRVATLAGEMYTGQGPVHFYGFREDEKDFSLLSRQRRQLEVKREIEQRQAWYGELDDQAAALELEQARWKAIVDEAAARRAEIRLEYEQAVLEANRAALEVEQSQRQLDWLAGQGESLRGEVARRLAEVDQLAGELSRLEAEHDSLVGGRNDARTRLASLEIDEAQEQATHWSAMAQVALRAVEVGRARQRELHAIHERGIALLNAAEMRISEGIASRQAMLQQLASHQLAYQEVGRKIASLQKRIIPAEEEITRQESEQSQVQSAEAEARQALNLAEHASAQARIALARNQEALETLRRKIEEDFGLVEFEYEEQVSGPTPLPLEGMVERLPKVEELSPELEETIHRLQTQMRRIGPINPEAMAEYQQVKERHAFLTEQIADLGKAEVDVRQVIRELDTLMQQEFRKAFEAVAVEFKDIFSRLFGGGSARLLLSDPNDLTNTGIEIEARLPGRRTQGLVLLSGGERSLTATALIFALLKVSPTPFCLLDEVDAMLDEANVGRFRELLRELGAHTQFVIVTHNRNTVQVAEVIYGVTMGRDSTSQVLSLKLDEVGQLVE